MRLTGIPVLAAICAITWSPAGLLAEPVDTAFTYQGQLKHNGVPADGDYDFRFRLTDSESGPSMYNWQVNLDQVPVSNGLFNVELDFGATPFNGQARWLEVAVRNPTGLDYVVLSPRQPVNAAPYAMYALGGPGGSGDFWAAAGNNIYNTNSGNVGVGTDDPSARLHAVREATTGTEAAIRGESNSTSAHAAAVLGTLTNDALGSGAAAVKGHVQTTSAFGIGVFGDHDGDGWGVHGTAVGGSGVYGSASASEGTAYGVRGRAWSPDAYGVYGTCSAGTGVYGYASAASGTNYGVKGETASPDGYAGYFTGGRNYFDGSVGIGAVPDARLDVVKYNNSPEANVMELKTYGTPPIWYSLRFHGSTIDADGWEIMGNPTALFLNQDTDGDVWLAGGGGNVIMSALSQYSYVGIGTNSPSHKLEVQANSPGDPAVFITNSSGGGGLKVDADSSNHPAVYIRNDASEYALEVFTTSYNQTATRIFSDNGPALDLWAESTGPGVMIHQMGAGNALAVYGGASVEVLYITGADVAEKFPASEEVNPGMVMAIDPKNPGKLCLSRGAYNRCVAGVVSGANDLPAGAVLGNIPGEESAPAVALSGRVWVHCDATAGPIAPGDLLTTAARPGHAMKVTDHGRAQGAVLGKAMTALNEGTGMVLVLVTLQ